MKELIQLQPTLKRRIFIYSLVSHSHSYILPMVGAFMIGFFFDNDLLCLIGCGIFLYVLAFGVGLIVPYCDRRVEDLMKRQLELERKLEQIETINQSLDERRDMMLFDEDTQYWQILEDLAV